MSPEIFALAIFCLTIIALTVLGTKGNEQEGDSGKTANKALDVLKSLALAVLKWFLRNP